MANTKIDVLFKQLARGKLISGAEVRNAFKTAEVNVLTLTLDELNKLNSIIDADLKADSPNTRSSAKTLKTLISSGETLEDGGRRLPPTKYSTLANIGEKIGKVQKTGWNLGHNELGNATQRLALILQEYKVGGARHLNPEESRLIESAIIAAQKLERLDDIVLAELSAIEKKDSDMLLRALDGSTEFLDIDLKASSTFAANAKTNKIRISYVFEDHTSNIAKGNLTRNLSNSVGKYLRNLSSKEGEALASKLDTLFHEVTDPFGISNSPNSYKLIDDTVTGLLSGKSKPIKGKGKTHKFKSKISKQRNASKRLITLVRKRTKSLKSKILAVQRKKKFIIPTVTLKAILNQSLAEFIQAKMEDANVEASLDYLRNQTGNFSRSALILTLNREQTGAIFGTYTYQHEPYQIFEKGNKLGSTGRDPRLYIEGAAREIAQQVLKKQFKGIALESK